ncbi:ABC transporter substrate-binding protein [Aurantibacillus circumpalustris]|uniref:ABC transporter substrate-binding protein n=1 Tax=Aurantibacillus circumpalustris TaxID=3036359 RepID=UPI00295A9793|nr:ABC transporter substrate-binding protein [Aurantibacillus circumpalustris]
MRKLLASTAFFLVLLLWSCSNDKNQDHKNSNETKGGVYIGGFLRVNEVNNIKSLMPIAINEVASYHLASQVYEGLVKYNQMDLSIMPGLARSWEISADLMEYTFHLRSDVKFHNDPCFKDSLGRNLVANDVKYCFENLCSKNVNNSQYDVTFKDRVEGANDFFAESKSGKVRTFRGITVIDDSTIKIRLVHGDANFLNILAMPGCYIYPREAEQKYGNEMHTKCVGTGPFYIETIKEGEAVVMKKNSNYWAYDKDGNRLPYLDGVKWTFVPDKKTEVMEFRRGNYDMIYRIPVEMFHDIFGEMQNGKRSLDFDIYSSPALSTHYYGFNLQTNPFFSLKEIRQAFNLAIDRQKIADYTIKGEGRSADYGMVPYTEVFEKMGYDYKGLKGYKYNPDSAKKLMALAGYPDGKGLPSFNLEINSGGGDRNILVALVVQKMLKENLGVNVNMNVVTWPEHIDNIQSGKSDFFRYAWIADYPDPESFLTLFYGKHVPANYLEKSYVNFGRFKNKMFDSLFVSARSEPDKAKRYKLFSKAEQIVLDEAACMPLFYDENFRLEQKNVRNLPENPMNYIDMSTTYLIPKKK